MKGRPADCPFCPKLGGKVQGATRRPVWDRVRSSVSVWGAQVVGGVYAVFEPLNPVTPGHLLVVPAEHVEHAKAAPNVAAGAMEVAATIAKRYRSANIITSIGVPATQSVRHLHLHVVPRHKNDGLLLPWSAQ